MPLPALRQPASRRNAASLARIGADARIAHFLWLCRSVSPLVGRDELNACQPDPVAWDWVFALASSHGILPSLYPSFEAKGLLPLAPQEAQEGLRVAHGLHVARVPLVSAQMERLSRLLNAIDVVPLWLKGAARLIDNPEAAECRTMVDLDFWVPPPALERVIPALQTAGYRRLKAAQKGDYYTKHLPRLFCPGERLAIEVHFELADECARRILPTAPAVARALSLKWHSTQVLVPSLADQIVQIACQDIGRLAQGVVDGRRLLELTALCAEYGVEAAVELLRETFAAAGDADHVEALLEVAQRCCGLPGEFRTSKISRRMLQAMRNPRLHAFYCLTVDSVHALVQLRTRSPWVIAGKINRRFRIAAAARW